MRAFELKVYVGQEYVAYFAEKFERAGVKGVRRGSMHVYCHEEALWEGTAPWNLLVDLYRAYGTDWNLKPVVVGEVKTTQDVA